MLGRRQIALGCTVAAVLAATAAWAVATRWHGASRSGSSAHGRASLVAVRDEGSARAGDGGRMTPELAQALRLDPASVRTLGVYRTSRGTRFEVSSGHRRDGAECIVAVGYGGAGSSCGGLFASGPVAFLETAGGGPELQKRTDLEIAGLARPDVARVAVVDSRHATRWATLNANHTFMVEFTTADLQAGVGPVELDAYGAAGTQVTTRIDLTER
jgi:hypothetical protein